MSAVGLKTLPYVQITQGATTRRVPVQVRQDKDGNVLGPVPVGRQPKISFPQPVAIAGPDSGVYRRNYDVDEAFLADWSGGLSVDKYPPSVAPSGASYGELDTRSGNYLTPPRLATDLGDMPSNAIFKRFLNPGFTSATILTWRSAATAWRYQGGTTWTALAAAAGAMTWYDATEGLSYVWAVGYTAGPSRAVYRSADGINWDTMAKGAMTIPSLVCCFDERVCALDDPSGTNGVVTLYTSADVAGAAAGGGTWVAGNSFRTTGNEVIQRLFTWMYPLDRGKPTLWCLTSARLLYYDYYGATPTWKAFFTFRSPYATQGISDAYVWPVDGNLYTCISPDEHITQFTGNAVTRMKMNRHGGLPSAQRLVPMVLGGDRDFVYAFCGTTFADANALGGVVAIAPGGAVHHVYRPTTASYFVGGGGVGLNALWVARYEGGPMRVWQIENGDPTVAPMYRATTSTYDAAARQLVSGWLHCNLLNVNKRALYFEVDCLKMDGTPGLESSCTAQVEYQGRGTTSWTSAGTLTSASTFPAVLTISGGFAFKELRVRLTLQRGSTSTVIPIVAAVKVGYRPQPKQRYSWTFRVDVRDDSPAFKTPDRKFYGYSASQLRAFLLGLGDNDPQDLLVSLSYGGQGNSLAPRYTSISQAEVSIQGQESASVGDGVYLLVCNDVSSPSSG